MLRGIYFSLIFIILLFASCSSKKDIYPLGTGLKVKGVFPLEKGELEKISVYEPDTFVRFSPDAKYLAIGTFFGRIKLIDVQNCTILWEKRISEGMVKKIDFSPDGNTLYLGEQSPDGNIYAMDVKSGKELWRFNLSRDLFTGSWNKDDPYGIYRLPGCYRLKVLKDGSILILGIHSFPGKRWRRLSRLYLLDPSGKVKWAFPREGPMERSIIYADADPEGKRVAFVTTLGSEGIGSSYPYPEGAIFVLDGKNGEEVGRYKIKPLKPFYDYVSFWQSISIDKYGKLAVLGTYDGRVFIFDLDTVRPKRILHISTPIVISNIPVSASSTYVHISKDGTIYVETGKSTIPYGLKITTSTPPGPHPHANTLWAISQDGDILWRFSPGRDFRMHGFASSSNGRFLAVCADSTNIRDDEKLFGLFLFDTWREGGGMEKLYSYYPTSSPCFFHLDMSSDGRYIAIVEVPYRSVEMERFIGNYRVLLLERE